MAVSKERKNSAVKPEKLVEKKASKPEVVKAPKPEVVKAPKPEALVLKYKAGDRVKLSGEEWEVLIVVDKKGRERLRLGREGALKAVWIDDLD
jgi:hypothetical protein